MNIFDTPRRWLATLSLGSLAIAIVLYLATSGLLSPLDLALCFAAVAVALAAFERVLLTRRLRRANETQGATRDAMRLAEELAAIGRIACDRETGEMQWSRGMCAIHGREPGKDPTLREWLAAMPVCGPLVHDALVQNEKNHEPFGVDYQIQLADRHERTLRLRLRNRFDETGKNIGWGGVAMDITDQSRREATLEAARSCAMQLAAETRTLAETDSLTGLANRRRTLRKLESAMARAEENDTPLAVISFDLDRFKAINDRHGHQTGDEVLIRTAERARAQIRTSDLVGRVGGEEFIWILPGATSEQAMGAGTRLREAIAQSCPDGTLPDVTASIGIAAFEPGDDMKGLLARADRALYKAKHNGRNRVRYAA